MSQPALSPWQRNLVLGIQRFIYWLSKHWLAMVNLFILVYVGLPFAAPVLMKAGWTAPARVVYTIYKPLCHQLAFRSWFLFGEEPVYPRAEYEARVGMNGARWPELFAQAREFVGGGTTGYKVGLCERDVATYAALFLAGLTYAVLRRRGLRPMPFWLFILVGVLPIGLDGGSQFVSLFISAVPARESVWQLRVLTGGLFGLSIAWLAYPYIQEGMDDSAAVLAGRYGWDGHAQAPEADQPTTRDKVVQLLEDKDLI